MKIKYFGLFMLVLLFVTVAVSCRSTPPMEEILPEPEASHALEEAPVSGTPGLAGDPNMLPPDQVWLNDLAAASQRAEEARALIADFNGAANLPEDRANAENLFNQARNNWRSGTVGEVRDSIALYDAAADAYRAMLDGTMAYYIQDLENEIINARSQAMAAGASHYAPNYLLEADNTASDFRAQLQSRDYYNARESGILARDMYRTLIVVAEAHRLRQEIEDRDFFRFDSQNIIAADNVLSSALDDFVGRNIPSSATKADDARSRYTQSLNRGWEFFALEWGEAATAERQKALDARANVALSYDFDAANEAFNQGLTSFQAGDFDQSVNFYMRSRDMFIIVTDTARERRRLAEIALQEAGRRLTESEEFAQRAELIIDRNMP